MAAQVHYWKAETLAEAGDYDGSRKEFLLLADNFPSSNGLLKPYMPVDDYFYQKINMILLQLPLNY